MEGGFGGREWLELLGKVDNLVWGVSDVLKRGVGGKCLGDW